MNQYEAWVMSQTLDDCASVVAETAHNLGQKRLAAGLYLVGGVFKDYAINLTGADRTAIGEKINAAIRRLENKEPSDAES